MMKMRLFGKFECFIESLYTKSFFDEEKLIIINRGSDKILEIIKDLEKKLQ